MNRVKTCMHDKCMGLYRKLTLRFVNMLNYGILWAPFSLKTLLEESPPAGARKVQRTVPGAPLLILENFCCCLSRCDLSPLGLQAEADPGGGLRGLQPPLWEVFKLVWLSLFHAQNNIICYNVSSSPIDRYKKTVAIPFLDSLIIQMQGRFSDEHHHASHLLYVVPSIIVNKALQQDDEVEGMLFWEKDIPFLKSFGN